MCSDKILRISNEIGIRVAMLPNYWQISEVESSRTHFQVLTLASMLKSLALASNSIVLENLLSSAQRQHYFLIGKKEKNKQKTTYLVVCQSVVSFRYLKNNTV